MHLFEAIVSCCQTIDDIGNTEKLIVLIQLVLLENFVCGVQLQKIHYPGKKKGEWVIHRAHDIKVQTLPHLKYLTWFFKLIIYTFLLISVVWRNIQHLPFVSCFRIWILIVKWYLFNAILSFGPWNIDHSPPPYFSGLFLSVFKKKVQNFTPTSNGRTSKCIVFLLLNPEKSAYSPLIYLSSYCQANNS